MSRRNRKAKLKSQTQLTLTDSQIEQPLSNQLTDPTKAMLLLLLEMDISHEFLAILLEVMLNLPPALSRYLGGAVIVSSNAWGNETPNRAIKAALRDRLEQVLKEWESGKIEDYATPAEVLCFMYGATMEAPITHSATRVYEWCFMQTAPKYKWIDDQFVHQLYPEQWHHSPEFEEVKSEYYSIARQIRKTVVNTGKSKGLGSRTRRQEQQSDLIQSAIMSTNTKDNENNLEQITLF